jgi:hypothetical protein
MARKPVRMMARWVDPSFAARTLTCRLIRAGTMTCNETSLFSAARNVGVVLREAIVHCDIMSLANHDVFEWLK